MPNHPKDRHAAAAAVKSGAQLIVTHDRRDFRPLPDGIEALHPDRFLCDLFDLAPQQLLAVIRHQAADLRRTTMTPAMLLERLAVSAPRFAALARVWCWPPRA